MRIFAGSTSVIYLTENKTIRNGVKGLIGQLNTKKRIATVHAIGFKERDDRAIITEAIVHHYYENLVR